VLVVVVDVVVVPSRLIVRSIQMNTNSLVDVVEVVVAEKVEIGILIMLISRKSHQMYLSSIPWSLQEYQNEHQFQSDKLTCSRSTGG
jgi:hypothetical protein